MHKIEKPLNKDSPRDRASSIEWFALEIAALHEANVIFLGETSVL